MMDDSARGTHRSRWSWLPVLLTTAATIATAGLALVVAACSGPSSAGSGGSPDAGGPANFPPASSQALAFALCMRSHGVPRYPEPNGSNTMPNGLPKVGPQHLGITM